MGNTGALLLHGLFEHKGRHQINADWFNNLKIDTNLIDLPGHGKDDLTRGDIESWELNDQAVIKGFESLSHYDNKIFVWAAGNGIGNGLGNTVNGVKYYGVDAKYDNGVLHYESSTLNKLNNLLVVGAFIESKMLVYYSEYYGRKNLK